LRPAPAGQAAHMCIMLVVWTALIASGIIFFTVIGLTHG
jgi:hypothetical protein